jgi:hypothetical protein
MSRRERRQELAADRNFWLIAVGIGLALPSPSRPCSWSVTSRPSASRAPTPRSSLAMALFGIVGKLGAGWLIDRVDARAVVAGALALHALGWAIVARSRASRQCWSPRRRSASAGRLPAVAGGAPGPLLRARRDRARGRLHGLIGLPFLLAAAPLVGWSGDAAAASRPCSTG